MLKEKPHILITPSLLPPLCARPSLAPTLLPHPPGIAERLYPSKDMLEETPQILINLIKSGYRIMQVWGRCGGGRCEQV